MYWQVFPKISPPTRSARSNSIGVEVVLGQPVTDCTADGVVYGGNRLEARTIVWAAGVRASRAAEWLNAPADRAGPFAGRCPI